MEGLDGHKAPAPSDGTCSAPIDSSMIMGGTDCIINAPQGLFPHPNLGAPMVQQAPMPTPQQHQQALMQMFPIPTYVQHMNPHLFGYVPQNVPQNVQQNVPQNVPQNMPPHHHQVNVASNNIASNIPLPQHPQNAIVPLIVKQSEEYGRQKFDDITVEDPLDEKHDHDDKKKEKKMKRRSKSEKQKSLKRKRKSSKPAKRDRNAPKLPQTAYTYFAIDRRELLKQENSSLSFGQISHMIGQAWKQISDFDKQRYVDMHQNDMLRYEREMTYYTPEQGSGYGPDGNLIVKKEKERKKKPFRDLHAPKLPVTAFQFFSNEHRDKIKAENSDINFGELSRAIASKWKAASPEEKEKYIEMKMEDDARYKKDMEGYQPEHGSGYGKDGNLSKEERAKQAAWEKRKPKRDPNAPRPSSPSFFFFSNEMRERIKAEQPSISFGTLSMLIGKEWKALSDEGRLPYIDASDKDRKRYLAELADYTPPEGYNERGILLKQTCLSEESESGSSDSDDDKHSKDAKDQGSSLMKGNVRPSGTTTKRPKRDPTAPRGPLCAYILWTKDRRHIIKREDPTLDFNSMSTRLSTEWKALDSETKAKYTKLAAEDRARYKREKEAHENSKRAAENALALDSNSAENDNSEMASFAIADDADNFGNIPAPSKPAKRRRDPNAPKLPLSAYAFWCRDRRPTLVALGLNFREISSRLGAEWKQYDEHMRQPYTALSSQDKQRFERESDIYKSTLNVLI